MTAPPRTRPDRDDARVARVPLDRLRAHPRNVRHDLGDLRELAASIAADGVLVPVMAERRGEVLQLLHGHRRAAAAGLAGLRSVPCVVVPEHSDEQAIVVMVAENTRRRSLSPVEKRDAIAALHDQHDYTYSEIADRLGISVATVYAWRRAGTEADEALAGGAAAAAAPELDDEGEPAGVDDVGARRQARTEAEPAAPQAAAEQAEAGGGRSRAGRGRGGAHVVSRRRVADLAERWRGHAPPALLSALCELCGDLDATAAPSRPARSGRSA